MFSKITAACLTFFTFLQIVIYFIVNSYISIIDGLIDIDLSETSYLNNWHK